MHNVQCCHASLSLQKAGGRSYLRLVHKDRCKRTKDETRNIMNLVRSYRNWRRYRDTVNELNRLSNRELTDLGISRSDIPFVAKKAI